MAPRPRWGPDVPAGDAGLSTPARRDASSWHPASRHPRRPSPASGPVWGRVRGRWEGPVEALGSGCGLDAKRFAPTRNPERGSKDTGSCRGTPGRWGSGASLLPGKEAPGSRRRTHPYGRVHVGATLEEWFFLPVSKGRGSIVATFRRGVVMSQVDYYPFPPFLLPRLGVGERMEVDFAFVSGSAVTGTESAGARKGCRPGPRCGPGSPEVPSRRRGGSASSG